MAKSALSPEPALAQLKRIHRHQIKVNERPLTGVPTLTKEQSDLFGAITLKKSTQKAQLAFDL